MVSLKENRMLILEKDGEWVDYLRVPGYLHEDCLRNYAKRKQLENNSIEHIIKKEQSAIIYIINEKTLLGFLPAKITDEQMYQLDLFTTTCLNDVEYLEVKKYNSEQEHFTYQDNIAEKFSNEVIQSYFKNKSNSKLKRR